jgi:hypothetical protein
MAEQNQKKSEIVSFTNGQMWTEGNKLFIVVKDLTERVRPSSTGVTTIIAGGDGNLAVPGADGVKVGLNVYIKNK